MNERASGMQALNLRAQAPRRWSERIDGVAWLPRLIDKARAAHAGTLGDYLFGQSPMDRTLLHVLSLGHAEFARIVAHAPDDRAVVESLSARDPHALDRARAWSEGLARRHRLFLFAIDIDDGYATGIWTVIKPAANAASNALVWMIKRLWPSRAIERSKRMP
ncbi:MAG TPA: DUF5069 domain-containing protein [Candidatus Baltobacteraceae bacterium]|nr:DUF5069 domain-containing protein [Candidatus Baltobacteraceae bacterium]